MKAIVTTIVPRHDIQIINAGFQDSIFFGEGKITSCKYDSKCQTSKILNYHS